MANITVNSEKMKVKYYKLIRLSLHHILILIILHVNKESIHFPRNVAYSFK